MSNFLKALKVKGIEIDTAGASNGDALVYNGTKFGAASVGGSAVAALNDLTDVVITSPATTQFVRYNGTNWVNATISAGDVPTLNQNTTGTAATVTGAAQTAITSVGTLTALTVTGDLTVDTTTLKVDSTNNRVGIGTASPSSFLHVASGALGGTAGDELIATQVRATNANQDIIYTKYRRVSTGADWTSAQAKIQRTIDATDMGYVAFGGTAAFDVRIGSGTTDIATFASNGTIVTTSTAAAKVLVVKGAASQSGDFLDIQDSGGTSQFKVNSVGNVGIGVTPSVGRTLTLTKTITGATTSFGILNNGVIQSDVTASATYYRSGANTVASAFTLSSLFHFQAAQVSFGAGSTVTTQIGFVVDSAMTGATNNYGFYSDIASGTGRWNFMANGTAANYMAGRLGVGALLTSGAMAQIVNTTAADKAFVVKGAASQSGSLFEIQNSSGTALVTVNSSGDFVGPVNSIKNFGNGVSHNFCARADSSAQGLLAGYSFYPTFVGTGDNTVRRAADISAGFTGAWATEYLSFGVGTGATNDAAVKTTERMRITGAGNVGIGTSSPTEKLDVVGNIALTGSVVFEGATADGFETTLSVTDPTADRTITLPNASGTVALIAVSDTAPTSPVAGNLWYKSDTGAMYVYYDSFWIEVGSPSSGLDGGSA